MKIFDFTCSVCKVKYIHNNMITTGYATNAKGEKICYECCAVADKEYMEKHGKITLYLAQNVHNDWYIGNWPMTLQMKVIGLRKGRHNIAGSRYDFSFKDHKGKLWYGVQYGENTQIARCRRYKNQN